VASVEVAVSISHHIVATYCVVSLIALVLAVLLHVFWKGRRPLPSISPSVFCNKCSNDYSVRNDESLCGHCTNERRVKRGI